MAEENDVIQYIDNYNVESLDPEVEQQETVDYIVVEPFEETVIDVDEAVVIDGSQGVPSGHTHDIEAIDGLVDLLKKLGSPHEMYSQHSGIAEFRYCKTPIDIDRFVSLKYQNKTDPIIGGNTFIEVCNGDTDVYGVTVGESAFCGNQNEKYCLLNLTKDNNIIDDNEIVDNNEVGNCVKVCLLGVARVRQAAKADYHPAGRDAQVGDYVVSGKDGCAVYSESGVGFRVVAVGQMTGAQESQYNYRYVDIALVPQNDNVARVMKELEGTKQNVGNLSIQIGKFEEDINNVVSSVITDVDKIADDLKDVATNTNKQLDAASKALTAAQTISKEASAALERAKTNYTTAKGEIEAAKTSAENALGGVAQIAKDMEKLKQHEDKIVGFFTDANEDGATLATVVKQQGDITLIKQKVDKNGGAIQHLVAHADTYSVGNRSITYGLSYDEAKGVMGEGMYFYIPLVTHTEKFLTYTGAPEISLSNGTEYYINIDGKTYSFTSKNNLGPNNTMTFDAKVDELSIFISSEETEVISCIIVKEPKNDIAIVELQAMTTEFEVNQAYIWTKGQYTDYEWKEDSDITVSINTKPTNPSDGHLWYTHSGERNNNVWTYEPNTLYRWDAYNENEGIWIAVARANDGNARTMSYINQTAEYVSSTVTNMKGDVSNISQEVDKISLTVSDMDGTLTRINQTAKDITLGVYSPKDGVSSLEMLLGGMRSVSSYSEHVCVGEFSGSPASGTTRYVDAPVWTNDGFSFDGIPEADKDAIATADNPIYYFDADKKTYYCKQIDDDTYEIHTIGNQALAGISSRVSDTEAAITRLTSFEAEAGTRLTAVEEKSDINGAQISSIAAMQDAICVEVKSELTADINEALKYSSPPVWDVDDEEFKFTGQSSGNGVYCITNNTKEYYKIIDTASGKGYERYELLPSSVKLAGIEQKVDANGASIELVVQNGKAQAGFIVDAINDADSSVLIQADKISINGTTTFSSIFNTGTTTINGDYIKSGVIQSNNYNEAELIYFQKSGVEIDVTNKQIKSNTSQSLYYTTISSSYSYILPSNRTFYYTSSLSSGSSVLPINFMISGRKGYIVCQYSYSNIIRIDGGVKLDLNNGTIYSKNLTLDTTGNLSISGNIYATSGYIADFVINNTSISSNQNSLNGGYSGVYGVYISPSGIGLGNGHFCIDNGGTIYSKTMRMQYTIGKFEVEDEGNTTTVDQLGYSISMAPDGNYLAFGKYVALDNTHEGMLQINRGNTIDCFSRLYMHNGYQLVNQSDSRLKTNIEDVGIGVLELLNKIELKSFDWIDTSKHVDVGIIAQQLEKVLPSLVVTDEKTGLKSISYIDLIPYLIKAVQELSEIVSPSAQIALLSAEPNTDTHWVDDMTEDEKGYYVKLSAPPRLSNKVPDATNNN